MRNAQQAILGSKHKGEKRLKRKRKLSRRVKCHGSKDNCSYHLKVKVEPKEQKVVTIPIQALKPVKKTWSVLLKERVLTVLRNTIEFIFKGKSKG